MNNLPLTVEDVARITKYKKGYIYKLVYHREIPCFRREGGRKVFFDPDEINEWLKGRPQYVKKSRV